MQLNLQPTIRNLCVRASLGATIRSTRSDFRSIHPDSAVPGGEIKISMQIYCWSRNAIQRVEKVGANIVEKMSAEQRQT
eukprot:1148931-Pleurochrysis_carterae.AAC.2